MTLELLLAQFDGLIQTPADVEKLNATILQWAVQGRLVPQCVDDEPASELITRNYAKQRQMIKLQLIPKQKKLTNIPESHFPFVIPFTWQWIRLGELGFTQTGSTPPTKDPSNYGNDYPFVRPSDISDSITEIEIQLSRENGLSEKGLQAGRLISPNSVMMVCIGSVGKVGFVDATCSCNQQINTLSPYLDEEIEGRFLAYFMSSPYFQREATDNASKTTLPILNKSKWSNIPFPLPPLAEQKRIVARVDELLGQTAVLAQQLASVAEQRRGVNTAVLHQLTTETSEVLQTSEVSTSAVSTLTTNFDHLYVDADMIAELKQAILQLAVQGRLVPQDERDENAAVLLERIAAENDLEIENQRSPYVPIELICDVRGGIQKSKNRRPDKNPIRYLTVAHVQRNWIDFSDERFFEVYPDELERWRLLSGDNLVVEGNGSADHIGRTAIFRGEIENCVHQNHLIRVRPNQDLLEPEYLNLFLNSPEGRNEMLERSRTTSGLFNLSVGRIKTIQVPLPPLTEQKRIVAKVDELFALCDQLAGQLTTAATSREQLLEAVLTQAT